MKAALAAVALVATLMALYVQLFERRSREAEDRIAAARLDGALAESRARLKAEIVAQLLTELTKPEATGQKDDQPRPGTVLRRGEAGGSSALPAGPGLAGSLACPPPGESRLPGARDGAVRPSPAPGS